MKIIHTFAVASVLFASTSFAAQFERLDQMSDVAVRQFSQQAEAASRYHTGDSTFEIRSFSYTLTNESEPSINTIKQLIYAQRAEGGEDFRPEFVHVTSLGRTWEGMTKAIESLLNEADKSEVQADRFNVTLRHWLKETLGTARGVKLYTVADGNSWGRCSSAVLFDEHEMEIQTLSSCWSE
jgi:hypothetical protein